MTFYGQEYVGAAKCKMCHNSPAKGAQFTKWKSSKHSKAMSVLSEADKVNPKCVKCHSTAANIKAEGVSCESCHGAGSMYKFPAIMKDKVKSAANGLIVPSKKVCIKCHNSESPNFKGFDYDKYKAMIVH